MINIEIDGYSRHSVQYPAVFKHKNLSPQRVILAITDTVAINLAGTQPGDIAEYTDPFYDETQWEHIGNVDLDLKMKYK